MPGVSFPNFGDFRFYFVFLLLRSGICRFGIPGGFAMVCVVWVVLLVFWGVWGGVRQNFWVMILGIGSLGGVSDYMVCVYSCVYLLRVNCLVWYFGIYDFGVFCVRFVI